MVTRPLRKYDLPILVTGGSGALARMVLHELLKTHRVPPDQVIATTRRPEKLRDLSRSGVVVRAADFDKPETLAVSFAGARRLLLISVAFEVPYVVGRRTRMHAAAIAAAIQAGVPHILYSSAPNAEPGNPAFWHADHYQSELALLNSGAKWTILRVWDWPRAHYQLFWRCALVAGVYRSPTASGGCSYISKEDTASALAAALLSPFCINRRFDLTGPEALTAHDVFRVLEGITRKQVKVVPGSVDEWVQSHCPPGLSEGYLAMWRAHIESQKGGWFGGVTNAVQELTGKQPMTMSEYLARIVHPNYLGVGRPMQFESRSSTHDGGKPWTLD